LANTIIENGFRVLLCIIGDKYNNFVLILEKETDKPLKRQFFLYKKCEAGGKLINARFYKYIHISIC